MKTSIYLRPADGVKLAALGMSASEAVREFCDARGSDGMPLRSPEVDIGAEEWAVLDGLGMTVGDVVREFCAGETASVATVAVMLADPGARDPSDGKPDKPPPSPHGWTFTGTLQRQPDGTDRWVGQHIARPSSLDELSRLVSVAPGRVRLGSAHILIVSEVSDG